MSDNEKTIFQKIIDREISAEIVHEDDRCIALKDISPQAPVHILVVPRKVITGLDAVDPSDRDLLGHLMVTVTQVAKKLNLHDGYRVAINCGDEGGQTVPHLHIHLLGGRRLKWPPG